VANPPDDPYLSLVIALSSAGFNLDAATQSWKRTRDNAAIEDSAVHLLADCWPGFVNATVDQLAKGASWFGMTIIGPPSKYFQVTINFRY